jgi:outer membrane lipoprotein SlyB
VTAIVVVAAVIMGLFLGWCVTTVITLALVSRSQERMQRKVRYWQAETARAQAEADRLSGAAAHPRAMPPEPEHEPWVW